LSGIAGIIHLSGSPPDRDQGHQLSAGIAHRGRDDKGNFSRGPAILVHRRFRTNSGETRQPLEKDGRVLVLDGQLYDRSLEDLVQDFDRRGADLLSEIDGSFAFALWDEESQSLWLTRDATGTRPLYWTRQGNKVAFASEIPPLLGLPWVSREFASDHIAEYLSFRYVHAPRTLYRAVQEVPPGHILRIQAGGERMDRWWSPSWAPPGTGRPSDLADIPDRLDMVLRRSVEKRIHSSNVDIAVLLSGGLDSSAILYHVSEACKQPTSFTLTFEEELADESAFASRVAKLLGAEHHLVRISSQKMVDVLESCTRAMGQPLPTAAAALQFLLFKELRSQAQVLLSGDGGDEVLGGRGMESTAARIRRNRTMHRLPGPLHRMSSRAARKLGSSDMIASQAHFGRDRKIGGSAVFRSSERVDLLSDPGMVRPGIRQVVLEPLYQEVDSDPINEILHVWQRGWLPADSLARSDRMASLANVEVRYPMLDKALLELTLRLPGPIKVHPKGLSYVTKWPLREAMANRLPESILRRAKRSMPSPLDRWLRTEGRDFLRQNTEALAKDPSGIFQRPTIRGLVSAHLDGEQNHGLKLWTLCLFHTWKQVMGS
jgi:asparagine synthase (glutamine-hydrolysing)